ncbi:MAG: class I SAM-dependent methyltransferase [Longimicrobiales bacterium]
MSRARARLERAYRACQRVIAPGLRYSQSQYEQVLREVATPGLDWLDTGCGRQLLPAWREAAENALVKRIGSVTGLDPDWDSIRHHRSLKRRVRGSVSALPFPDRSFDLVTANMVVEHLERPEVEFAEILRTLRPGGRFLFHTPNAAGYIVRATRLVPQALKKPIIRVLEGRTANDVFPTFYRANRESDLVRIAAATGFDIEWIRPIRTDAVFTMVLPLAIPELVWIRWLGHEAMRQHRPDLLVSFRRSTAG